MDEFDRATNYLLRVPDHRELFKTLTTIRSHLEGPLPAVKEAIQKINDRGCIKVLISCLLQRRLYIINTSLSILGRCCMEKNFVRISVNRYNLVAHLNTLLKRTNINAIRIRVFRIIGTMCQHWDRFANTIVEKEPSLRLIDRIVNFLKSSSTLNLLDESESAESVTAIMLGIRTLRELANKDTIICLVDLGVINAIGVVLIHFTPLWLQHKKHEDLLLSVIKLIYNYSKYRPTKLISELQGAEGGDAMLCLGKMVELCPSVIIKVIVNLLHIAQSRSDLPFAALSESLSEKLSNLDTFSDGYEDKAYREYLKCLCFLVNYPEIRENLQNTQIILSLMKILDSFVTMSDITIRNSTLIIATLSAYAHDANLLFAMLQNGITSILVKNLNWALGPNVDVKEKHNFKPKKNKTRKHCTVHALNRYPENPLQALRDSINTTAMLYRTSSPYSDSILSSGSQSPLSSPNISEVEATESDSDDYSPVCSDVDCEFQIQPIEHANCDYSPYNDDVDERLNLPNTVGTDCSTLTLKIDLTLHIVKLVKLFIIVREPWMELINPSELLLKLLTLCTPQYNHILPGESLCCMKLLARRPEFLIGLMQTNFFPTVHRMTLLSHESCFTCDELYSTGKNILGAFIFAVEHRCGKGDIAHQLYRGNEQIKKQIVPVIPLVVNNKKILHQLMQTAGGLEILVQLIREDSDLQLRNIFGLSSLSKKLGIVNPTRLSYHKKFAEPLPFDLESYTLTEDCLTVVYFKLDDGSIVQADRDFLCEKSIYFQQMLMGMFKEAQQEEIILQNASKNALKFLFLLLKMDFNNKDVYNFDTDLQTLLEVIILSDRFLLEDYCICLTNSVQTFKFSPKAIPIIYKWSLESLTDILRIECVAYALVVDTTEDSLYGMFKSLIDLNHTEQLTSDICELLNRQFKTI